MKTAPDYKKLRGGYYTPLLISDFLATWAIQFNNSSVLEPSCGDGNFIVSSAKVLLQRGASRDSVAEQIQGVEIDELEAIKAQRRLNEIGIPVAQSTIHNGDFFTFCHELLADGERFDAIVGNPPFIRYQNFPEKQRDIALDIMRSVGLRPSRLTNIWVPFLVASTLLLSDRGRLAMVIPAELLQVGYAAELRRFLSDFYSKITLITFKKLVFDGVQQEVVLFLGERDENDWEGIRTVELLDTGDLAFYEHDDFSNQQLKPMDHSAEKWTHYFLSTDEIELLRVVKSNPNLTVAGDILDVDVGVVTGLNKYFVVNGQQANQHQLGPYTQPIIGRSSHLKGTVFAYSDLDELIESQAQTLLFSPPDMPLTELPKPVQDYVGVGEQEDYHTGYKCRIRKRWYIVPSVWTPQAFLLRQVYGYPKLILNNTSATCTDTIHRVKIKRPGEERLIVAAFMNSLTFALAEVMGRSYGGGVLELEPREAESLLIPLNGANSLDLDEMDNLVRNDDIDSVLDITDSVLLVKGLGMSEHEVKAIRGIWEKLRDRRIQRPRRKK
jgi:adenine-specific DNA-methyltransferase